MLLHIGDNVFLESEHVLMVLNVNSIYKKDSETCLKREHQSPKIEKNSKTLVLTDDGEIHQTLVDSMTIRKRDDVLAFLKKETCEEAGDQEE
jgi:hypothetical protein